MDGYWDDTGSVVFSCIRFPNMQFFLGVVSTIKYNTDIVVLYSVVLPLFRFSYSYIIILLIASHSFSGSLPVVFDVVCCVRV